MSPDKSHSHQRAESLKPNLAEVIVSACRSQVRGMRGISAAALLTMAAAMGCQPTPPEKCKDKVCDVSNPDNNGTPTDTTDTTDNNTDPTCPPDCPEVPDTTPPAAPQFGLGDSVIVGPSVASINSPVTIATDTEILEMKLDANAWAPQTFTKGSNSASVTIPSGSTAHLRAKDEAGNISAEDSFTVEIDTQGPSVPFPATATEVVVGPGVMSMPVTFTVPQPAETASILASVDDGAFAETAYDGGSIVTIDLAVGSSVKIKAVDNHDVDEGASAAISVLQEQAPASAELSQNFFQMGATTPATFSFDVTPFATARKIVIVDGNDNEVFSSAVTPPSTLPVSMPNPGTNTTYTVYSVAEKGTRDETGTPLSVEVMPAPTISNLGIDCSSSAGFCTAGNTYSVSFNFSNAQNYSMSATEISGGPIDGISFDQPTGNLAGNSQTVNITLGTSGTLPATVRITANIIDQFGQSVTSSIDQPLN